MTWANTLPGTTDVERCPGGVESFGNAMRFCNIDGTWDEAIVTECGSLTFKLILEQVNILYPLIIYNLIGAVLRPQHSWEARAYRMTNC